MTHPKFYPGKITATPGAMSLLGLDEMAAALVRHITGDWADPGDMDSEDREANDEALRHGDRLLSVYRKGETRFYCITEADRSSTTFLLPEEY